MKISVGNSKIGKTLNVSLTPGVTCSKEACATCFVEGCYARKSYRRFPLTREAWDSNTTQAINRLGEFEDELREQIDSKKPKYFRIHTAGDFVTKDYADMWFRVMKDYPYTKFLAFTKQFKNICDTPFCELENGIIKLSAWPGLHVPDELRKSYSVAWLDDGRENRIPTTAVQCKGDCTKCRTCWDVDADTVFHKHRSINLRLGGAWFMEYKINNVTITDIDIDDIMASALEGGITYWCTSAKVVGDYLGEYASDQISRGGALRLYDEEDDEWYTLTRNDFLDGLELWIDGEYDQYDAVSDDKIDTSEIDGEAADAIIQLALFGDVLFG